MRRLLEWLDVSHMLSGTAHVAVGLFCLTVVSGALISSMTSTEAMTSVTALGNVAAAEPMHDARAMLASVSDTPSIAVPAVFRSADATATLLHSAVVVSPPVLNIKLGDLEKERRCLTEGIYFEARGESAIGQLAVAEVVLNRVMSGRYPASICGVVFQGAKSNQCQFSFACNGDMRKPRDPVAWRKAQRLAHYVLAGKVRNSIVGSATYYHASYVSPYWAPHMVEVAKIGQHIFYRTADAVPDPQS
ncbi:MAG: cell wall hydrolase [Parvibaculum sp.]|uniref:cell wall hydrolase n=1 Tax=Parvibaculum sp. TaxID=2024848 RepID=UPI003C777A8D